MISYTQKPKGIIFDCDGVIVDSYSSNTQFYNNLRKAVNLPPMTEEQRILVHQMTGIEAFNLVIPKALQEEASKSYRDVDYVRDVVPTLTIYDGLHEFLELCKSQDILMGIHTNRIIAMEELLVHFNLKQFYNPVMTPAILPSKPDPIGSLTICKEWDIKTSEALFIGDSMNDFKTAKAAEIPFIAFGESDLGAQNHASSYADLISWIKSL